MTIILGLDPGTRITGYGLIRISSQIEPLDYGCIRPPPNLELEKRYKIIFDAIETLILRHKPASIAVESQFIFQTSSKIMRNPQSTIKLGMAKGMAFLAAARAGISIHEYTPLKTKKAVVGKGSASKFQVQQMVAALLRLPAPPNPEDAADALAIAICHAHTLKRGFLCTNTSGE